MRREDRIAELLHPEIADLLLNTIASSESRPTVNDQDICLYCRRHQCIAVCPTGALTTRGDGRIELIENRCCGCGACVLSCYEFGNLAWIPNPGVSREESSIVLD
jgi:Fe-S-cluster-containing dehydrogenase component